jgi:hypothetical protein
MKSGIIFMPIMLGVLLTGCGHRAFSISHSQYKPQSSYGQHPMSRAGSDPDFDYKGELSEFDVLGITRGELASEAQIRQTLDNSTTVKLPPGSAVLLIQSGAFIPDAPMVTELSKEFRVIPFSGVPPLRAGRVDAESYSKSLRLTAARAGAEAIVCYWGMLESESQHLVTKTVSWVPVVNWIVPDEKQHMRIRLKIALIDVRTGKWAVISPQSFESERISTSPTRGAVDQKQVGRLKEKAYQQSAKEVVSLYSGTR